jgi:two-component system nitrogen regulation sensor histidine kinase NtrY
LIRILKTTAYRYGYLIIAAAWLYTISFLFSNYFASDASADKVGKVLTSYLTEKERTFEALCKDTQRVRGLIIHEASEEKEEFTDKGYGLFVYAVNDIGNHIPLYWNTNQMSVQPEDLNKPDGYYAVKYKNGFFELLKKTIIFQKQQYIIAGMVPVYWDYSIENSYVQKTFAVPNVEKRYNVSTDTGYVIITNSLNTPVFYLSDKDVASPVQAGDASIVLRVIALMLLMIFINSLANTLVERIGFTTGLVFLLIIVVPARVITYVFPSIFGLKNLPLFSPDVFASSTLHPSLGDLLINTLLIYWLIYFIKTNSQYFPKFELPGSVKRMIGVGALLLFPLFTMELTGVLSSLVLDGVGIPFDVTSFFDLNIYTLVSFIIICFLLLSYFYTAQILVKLSHFIEPGLYWRVIILLSFALFMLSFKLSGDNDTLINFAIIAWIILFYFFLELDKNNINNTFYKTGYFIPWSIFLITSVSALLIFQNRQLEHTKRSTIAENLSLKSDYTSAKILDVALTGFSNFIGRTKFSEFSDSGRNRRLKENLINNNFFGYLNNFYTRIYTFDNHQSPLYNTDSASYNVLKSIIVNQSKVTDVPELYYYENDATSFNYIYERDIYSVDSFLQGHIFLIISPKRYGEEGFNPQLFRQLIKDETVVGKEYAYAVYNKQDNLIKASGNYNFTDTISMKQVPKFGDEYVLHNGYSELWHKASDNRIVVVAKKNIWFIESVTFFAYLFGLLIILIAIQHFAKLVFNTHFNPNDLRRIFRFNIRTQIQAIIISVSIISFIIIGITIISFFIISFNGNNQKKLMGTAEIIVKEIQELADENYAVSDIAKLEQTDLSSQLQQKILDIAIVHDIDLNLFDLNGSLVISSQKYVYDNAILSNKMDPKAYNSMHFGHSTRFIQEEQVVDYKFQTIYVPVQASNKVTFAYLNIPSFNTQKDLKQEISNFLITILDLNALIFIMAGAIAIWITKRITTSFTLIGNKMKAISFGAVNEEIEWKKEDELGELIAEYNKMVRKLTESAEALARSEREGAWREMARQVAHEIKNPLTPMKLSIQYLQRAIDNNAPNVKDLSTQVAGTLVEQIDQLSKIAGDFSQFANIANVNIEIVDLSNIIEMIVQLFSADERIEISWQKEEGNYLVEADRTQMNRLFTNLIKNAIEAHEDVSDAKVFIQQTLRGNEVLVSVKDNGHGIPLNMRPKIFTPNFTTKSSGTGLGLAICKGIVEKANGHIWFDTKENQGTTFFVSLPLAENA